MDQQPLPPACGPRRGHNTFRGAVQETSRHEPNTSAGLREPGSSLVPPLMPIAPDGVAASGTGQERPLGPLSILRRLLDKAKMSAGQARSGQLPPRRLLSNRHKSALMAP